MSLSRSGHHVPGSSPYSVVRSVPAGLPTMSNGDVFADIAGRYDRLNWILSLGRDQAWRRTAIDRLPGGRILDLGAGTGAANEVFGDREVVALDPSPEMLASQRRVAPAGGRR